LPDGIFSNQKSKFGSIWEGLEMENVGIFYGHLEYIMAYCFIAWLFGNLCSGLLEYFFPVLVHCITENLATVLCSRKGTFAD
jgi:hypothetical protein